MKRSFVLFVLLGVACQSSPDDPTADPDRLSACCREAVELRADIEACCLDGMKSGAGCCAEGLAEATPDEERPECCRQALEKLDAMAACCREAMTGGEISECCRPMTESLWT